MCLETRRRQPSGAGSGGSQRGLQPRVV